MSTFEVARKDFEDGIRSQVLIGLTALFAVFMAGAVYYFTNIVPIGSGGDGPSPDSIIDALVLPTYILLPLIGTVLGYRSISGERESGSLKWLLGLPHTRRDVVFGKLLGRSGIMAIAVVVGFAIGGIALYAFADAFELNDYLILVALAVVLGVTFVSIAIAFSSAVRSSTMVTSGAIGLVLLFVFLWQVLLTLVRYAADQLSLIDASLSHEPYWYLFFQNLNPTNAFQNAASAIPGSGITLSGPGVGEAALTNPPFYLEDWFGFVILAFWLVVPITLAFVRFQRTDL